MKSKLISQISIDYAKTEPLMKECFNVAKAEFDLKQYLNELMATSSQFVIPDRILELEELHKKLSAGKTPSLSNEEVDRRIEEVLRLEFFKRPHP